ncbi:MAG: Glycine cleavage system H protein [Alphaproteobacteria bacterium MarineAlpha5_Bin5]|nr:MAG: Glycine cleavage system H protein [Alphaproteobacteria bacterium MarineAlpha5_Bin4]PPR48952.1 MAG: Glycine cleavage system H protein [Alphaproteobacteria bacterium MarineAlpha5_Bin5]|tara:strand:+ start:230 stop:601 length:372 start_codon:yes stop_codon:yes gene_type:complete
MNDKKYTKDHEWILLEESVATIGISNHAQESLGDIVFIELPKIGKTIKAKQEICVIESVKAASDIYSPIDGEIIEINKELEKDATIINQDAENKGWIFKIKVTEPNQLDDLMSAEDYSKFLEQ